MFSTLLSFPADDWVRCIGILLLPERKMVISTESEAKAGRERRSRHGVYALESTWQMDENCLRRARILELYEEEDVEVATVKS